MTPVVPMRQLPVIIIGLLLAAAAGCTYEAWSQEAQPAEPPRVSAQASPAPRIEEAALPPAREPRVAAHSVEVSPTPVPPPAPAPPPIRLLDGPVLYRGRSFFVVDAPDLASEGHVIRYRVAVERGLEDDAVEFTQAVERVLGDPSGWAAAGVPLVRVDADEDITVLLAEPRTIDALCAPMNTGGALSCAIQRQANINAVRFRMGSRTWGDDVVGYRSYLINHEVGHLLGMRHEDCPNAGAPAPVMMQQTIRLGRCAPNGSPTAPEVHRVVASADRRDARWTRLKLAETRWRKGRGPAPEADPR